MYQKVCKQLFLICFVMFCSIIFPSHGDVTIAKLSVVERGRVICSDSEPLFFSVSSEYPKDCPNSVPFHDKQAIMRTYCNLRTCPWDQLFHNKVLNESKYSGIRGNWHVCHILTPINNSKFDFFLHAFFLSFSLLRMPKQYVRQCFIACRRLLHFLQFKAWLPFGRKGQNQYSI